MGTTKQIVKCKVCGKRPHQLEEYVGMASMEKMSPEEYVRSEEGTFNARTGLFYCTDCYIDAGEPLGTA